MNDFLTRLCDESDQLKIKIDNLNKFIIGDIFNTIDNSQQILLRIQLCSMQTYNQCLIERIKLLDPIQGK